MRSKRIFWQIFPSLLAITLLALAAIFSFASLTLRDFYERQLTDQLRVEASLMQMQMRDRLGNASKLQRSTRFFGSHSPARLTVVLPDGTVVADSDEQASSMENHLDRPEIQAALGGAFGQSARFSSTLRQNMMYVAVPIRANEGVIGVVRTAMPLTAIDQALAETRRRIIWSGIIILMVAAALSLYISRRISRPLEQIRHGAERFAQGDFSHRLSPVGSLETAQLSATMNDMASQLEERLQTLGKERNQREAILSSMVEGVLAVDTTGHIISLNKATANFFQVFEPDTAPGRSLEEVFRNVKLQKFVGNVLKAHQTRECDLIIEATEPRYLQAQGTNLLGVQGERIGAVIVFNDVSRLRRLENLRSDFVANVSHELKTPITSIKGYVETLLDGAINNPVEADRFLHIVAKHTDRLNDIIEDLLTLSRLEQRGVQELDRQPTKLAELIHSAVEVCSHRAGKKKISIDLDCPPDLCPLVNPPLIEQALINLVGNAIKYSEQGARVTISAKSLPDGMVVSVQDQGFGIEDHHLDRLFERFYRVDSGRSRQEGGTGLGLSIVKHIAQTHGGAVSVKSKFGQGSTFSIFLPAAHNPASPLPAPESLENS